MPTIPRPALPLGALAGRLAVAPGRLRKLAAGRRKARADAPSAKSPRCSTPARSFSQLGRLVSIAGRSRLSARWRSSPVRATPPSPIVAISLANRVFAFERHGAGFGARYRIEYEFARAGAPPVIVGQDKSIVVARSRKRCGPTRASSSSSASRWRPGNYQVTVRVRDLGNSQTGTARRTCDRAGVRPGHLHRADSCLLASAAATTATTRSSIVLNPRGTVAYGGDTLLIYLEGNGYDKPADLPVQVRDEHDSVVVQTIGAFRRHRARSRDA